MRHGLLLINIGTPNSASVAGVRTYLCKFLTDKRVIDIPAWMRYALVYGLIAPFRAKKSAKAYQAIWTEEGSPLLRFSKQLVNKLQATLGDSASIALGMHYSKPSIADALDHLKNCETLTILPLYPQYSSSATGAAIEKVLHHIAGLEVIPNLKIIRDFYNHPIFIKTQADKIKPYLGQQDHLLFSYHGIPERQIIKAGCDSVCDKLCPKPSEKNPGCYKAQCEETSRLLAKELQLTPLQYTSSFQSRLGKIPWIQPYTEEILVELANKGIKNLIVACPSFVTDCLETLEEIGIRAKQQWQQLGGNQLNLIPGLNDDEAWIKAILEITHFNSL